MPSIIAKAREQHRMLPVKSFTDALTGEDWALYACAECGELWKVQFTPFKRIRLRDGDRALTEADADTITALCKQGPVGQAKASEMMADSPSHALVWVPTEADLREQARQQGKLQEFEAAVDQAVVEGKPLVSFSLGGATAATWPKGTGRANSRLLGTVAEED